ncbi:MAG TPA: DNA-processing protein DprA [Polyangiaceae bacterium]|nr:DNA-processing protein DprA [Polyangiaceae bacterium]
MSGATDRCLSGCALPGRLADLEAPPARLFLRGELPRGPAVAIVGTRRPTEPYVSFAHELARDLAEAGVAVLSGGAEGIDTAAHRGALAAGGATVVVAPAGFERPFPEQNAELFAQIVAAGGAYLSLPEPNCPASRGIFFARNACLVALAHLVVVVESPIRSGARNAAAHARRLGRPLFVAPVPPWHSNGRGCLAELRLGAQVLISVKDLLNALRDQNLHPVGAASQARGELRPQQESLNFTETSPPETARAAALEAVRRGAGSSDEICVATGLGAGRVSELILTLRLEGVLVTDPSGRLQIHKRLI